MMSLGGEVFKERPRRGQRDPRFGHLVVSTRLVLGKHLLHLPVQAQLLEEAVGNAVKEQPECSLAAGWPLCELDCTLLIVGVLWTMLWEK
jgi:hypothetical protein